MTRHAAYAFHRRRWHEEIRSHFFGLICGGVDVIDLEVCHPVGRHSGLAVLCGRYASDEVLAVLDVQVARGIFRVGKDLPSEEAGVKIGRALLIGRAEVSPAKRAVDLGDLDALASGQLAIGRNALQWDRQ